ncbi:hypothetical protein bcere0029_10290 [Bacillus cereus AH1272]|nr:hypothetical protein bcere0029_10290 [Bacillus cereus AH1272]EEL94938.1 hypothetical protein bcere0030_10450 [Bacillus cereus AH1273]
MDETVQNLVNAGVINIETYNQKVEQYKEESPTQALRKQNAALILDSMQQEEQIADMSGRQADLILQLTKEGVL